MKAELFLSPVCPHCTGARRVFFDAAKRHPGDVFEEVDTYTEAGMRRGMSLNVMAVPTVAVDGVIKIVGWPFDEEDLDKALQEPGQ